MASGISSRTKVCGILVILEHTFSPAMHNAAFEAAGLDFVIFLSGGCGQVAQDCIR